MNITASKLQGHKNSQTTRAVDHIYDPLFTFSGPKTANEPYQSSSKTSMQPILESMFADMVQHPRATTIVLRPSQQDAQRFDASYKGKIRATPLESGVTAEVTGADRYKYFRRPVTSRGIMATSKAAEKLEDYFGTLSATMRVHGAQTVYRETESQTLPWTPPYTTHYKNTTEVLYLDQLNWEKGLPPGQHEVELVEHLRKKQAWLDQLPPDDTEANIKIRYKLITEMEESDWKFREKELQTINEERMKKSEQVLKKHVLLNRARLNYRMNYIEDVNNKKKERKFQLTRQNKKRALRKLCMKEKGYNPRNHKMNIVDEHLKYTSDLYAPIRRYGSNFRNRHEILAEKHITLYDRDLTELEYACSYRPLFDYNKASKPKRQTELCIRETRWTMHNLAILHQDLQTLRAKERRKIGIFDLQAIEQLSKTSRTLSPIPSEPLVHELKKRFDPAPDTIQTEIQEQAVESQTHRCRDHTKEEVKESKSTEKMTAEEISEQKLNKDQINVDKRLSGVMENIIGLNVGLSIGQTLDLLAKELLRFKNEGVAHSQAFQSECARWKKEVPESGHRQKEMRRREEHSLMFSQLLEVYQDSIKEFLDDLTSKAGEHEAKYQAFEHAKEIALLKEQLLAAERDKPVEPISADLLFEFIDPAGLRQLALTCMLILKQKYEEARQQLTTPARTEQQTSDSETNTQCASTMEPRDSYEEDTGVGVDSQSMDMKTLETRVSTPLLPRLRLVDPIPYEEKLLSRVLQDMCHVAGALLHTAAKMLNKALQLSNIPQDKFEEALRRTMLVINEAREEISNLISPKPLTQPQAPQPVSSEIMIAATAIVDDVIKRATQGIIEAKRQAADLKKTAVEAQARTLIEEVMKEAQRKIFQTVVEDFLTDLFREAMLRAAHATGTSQQDPDHNP